MRFKNFEKMELNAENVIADYAMKFGEPAPMLTTLSIENPHYLKELRKAIDNNKPTNRDELAKIFMPKAGEDGICY